MAQKELVPDQLALLAAGWGNWPATTLESSRCLGAAQEEEMGPVETSAGQTVSGSTSKGHCSPREHTGGPPGAQDQPGLLRSFRVYHRPQGQ